MQFQKKLENFKKVKHYLQLLKEKPAHPQLCYDNHFYKMSIYIKMASLIVQFVFDIVMGLAMLYFIKYHSQDIMNLFHYFG